MKQIIFLIVFILSSTLSFANDNNKENKKTVVIKVTNSYGEELPGAKVIIGNSGKEYICDFNGDIQLTINTNEIQTLKIYSIGYSEKSLNSNQLSAFNGVSLEPL